MVLLDAQRPESRDDVPAGTYGRVRGAHPFAARVQAGELLPELRDRIGIVAGDGGAALSAGSARRSRTRASSASSIDFVNELRMRSRSRSCLA